MKNKKRKLSNIQSHIRDTNLQFKNTKDDYKWLKNIHKRFKLLQMIFKNRPIYIYDYTVFEPDPKINWEGEPSYLDIQIELPSLPRDYWYALKELILFTWEFKKLPPLKNWFNFFQNRWVFTISNLAILLKEHSQRDIYDLVRETLNQRNKNITSKMSYEQFLEMLKNNPKVVMKKPIVEFDEVYTNEAFLTKELAIEYTKYWLWKYYPCLANRSIIWKEPKS